MRGFYSRCIRSRPRGFTLVELLVVIGIIGILATTIMVNLSSSRDKAKATSILQSLRSITSSAAACLDGGNVLGLPNRTSRPSIEGGNSICVGLAGSDVWPDLKKVAAEWNYDRDVNTKDAAGVYTKPKNEGPEDSNSNFYAGEPYGTEFSFGAYRKVSETTEGGKTIIIGDWYSACNQTGCVRGGY